MARNTPAPLAYDEKIEELTGLAETLGSKKVRDDLVRHLCPQPEMKFVRKVYTDTLGDLAEELTELVTRMKEAQAAFGAQAPAAKETEAIAEEDEVTESDEAGRQAVPA
jgi:hypothetical protein